MLRDKIEGLNQESIDMTEEDIRCQIGVLDRAHRGQVSSSVQVSSSELTFLRPPTSKCHNSFVRTPIRVFLDSMEIKLSQESIHKP